MDQNEMELDKVHRWISIRIMGAYFGEVVRLYSLELYHQEY